MDQQGDFLTLKFIFDQQQVLDMAKETLPVVRGLMSTAWSSDPVYISQLHTILAPNKPFEEFQKCVAQVKSADPVGVTGKRVVSILQRILSIEKDLAMMKLAFLETKNPHNPTIIVHAMMEQISKSLDVVLKLRKEFDEELTVPITYGPVTLRARTQPKPQPEKEEEKMPEGLMDFIKMISGSTSVTAVRLGHLPGCNCEPDTPKAE